MTLWFIYSTYIAAVNPARLRLALPDSDGRARPGPLAVGTAIAMAVSAVLIAVSSDLLAALEISPETWRMAAGIVIGIVGVRVLAFPQRAEEPQLSGSWAGLVPVAFPLLITPELIALVTIFGATEPAVRSIGGVAAALALGLGSGFAAYRRPSLWSATARLFGALLILGGIAMLVEGIRDV